MLAKVGESKKAIIAVLSMVCLTAIAIALIVRHEIEHAMTVVGYLTAIVGATNIGQSVVDNTLAKTGRK